MSEKNRLNQDRYYQVDVLEKTLKQFLHYPYFIIGNDNQIKYIERDMEKILNQYELSIENIKKITTELYNQKYSQNKIPMTSLGTYKKFCNKSVFYFFMYSMPFCHLDVIYVKKFRDNLHHFTEREIQIISYIEMGSSNNDIAEELNISIDTVKRHVSNLLLKTDSKNRVELLFQIRKVL